MTLTLKESCRLYEQYCRRRTSTPTFEEFNEKNGTCLPSSDTIYTEFKKSIEFARKNEGLPIRSRLKSLYNQLSKESPKSIAKSIPSVQIRPTPNNTSSIPSITNSFSMNIRTPEKPEKASIKNEELKKVESEDVMNWSTESYKKLLSSTSCKKVIEPNGLMVHLVSSSGISTEEELRATSCKLTKKAWNTLLGKSDDTLTMRDGSSLKMSSIKMDNSDLQKFVTSRKKKENGPYFIRFRTI